jgi:hypothetical protein
MEIYMSDGILKECRQGIINNQRSFYQSLRYTEPIPFGYNYYGLAGAIGHPAKDVRDELMIEWDADFERVKNGI